MSKHKKLREKFPDNKLVRFIATKGDCKLSLKERWVYSALLWRFKAKPVSKARLAKWTGVDRTRTLPRVLIRLSNLRLVAKAGQKYKAVQPSDDMMPLFATWIKGEGKHERLVLSNNWAVYSPDRDIIDNLVACDDALGHHAAAKLARRYGVSAKTITAARRRLKAQFPEAVPGPTVVHTTAEQTPVNSVEVIAPVKPITLAETAQAPLKPFSPAHLLAAQFAACMGITPAATNEIAGLCRLLKGLARKEIGQIVSAFVAKYGKGEGLEDAVHHFVRTHQLRYFTGASLERVMADIGVGCSVDADDDLSLVGDAEAEIAGAV